MFTINFEEQYRDKERFACVCGNRYTINEKVGCPDCGTKFFFDKLKMPKTMPGLWTLHYIAREPFIIHARGGSIVFEKNSSQFLTKASSLLRLEDLENAEKLNLL